MTLIDDFQAVDTAPAETEREVYVFPTSFAQRRLWFLSQLEPEAGAYHIAGAFDLEGRLRQEALARSFDEIVQRHEILRTTFSVLDGEPVQMVALQQPFDLEVVDFGHVAPADRDAEVDRHLAAELRRPFDLHRGPLLRAGLLRLDADRHVLYYVMHHIVSDGWSEEILVRELATLYQSFAAGRPSPLEELPIQYGDFAKWQREWLDGEVLAELVAYWKGRLAGASGVLDLPADHPRPEVATHRGASLGFSLPPRLVAGLRALGGQEGATLFSVLAAAFAVLLSRSSGQDDVLIGSPVANRSQMELEGLIGLFLDTVVVRADTSGNPTFRQLLAQVRETLFSAQEHQSLPFEKLVQELRPERDPSRNPLFQVWLNVQNVSREQPELARLAEVSLRPRPMVPDTVKFDLMLDVQEGDWGLNGSFTYNVDLFEPATIRRLRDHFQALLEGAVADPDRRVADIPLLGPGERHQLLVEWNDTRRDGFPHGPGIHDLFEAEAARRGDEIAAMAGDRTLSFRELDEQANRLARHLRALGVGPDVPVGVYLPRSLDLLAGILGILKAGGAYLPIDPAYPADRVAFVLADARSPVVLTHEVWKDRLREQVPHVLCLDADRAAWEAESGEALPPGGATAESLAYIIYTSGSTGRPKGVMVPHGSAVRYLRWCLEAYAIERGQGAPVHSSIGFDLTVTSLFAPLLAGRPATLIPEGPGAEPLEAVLSRRPRFSFVKLTPAHLDLLARSLPPGAAGDAASVLILGGETLPARSLEFWRENAPGVRVINEYGPTEATVGCTTYDAAGAAPYPDVPIGRPIADARIHLLDRFLQPVGLGVVGEVHIGGPQVTRGYLNRPGLTAERFVPDPFSGEPGARLYRTGDLARHLPDGTLRLLGRTDHQVKIRGYRIELGEVEAALAEHPALAEAVVVARDEEGTKRLVAYVVPRPEGRPTVDDLRQFLAAGLPEYMVPSAFVVLEALPLTAHGKVDRRALPEPDHQRPDLEQQYVPPRDALEDTLAVVWAAALGVDRVGIHDNFFTLGGDSIRSIQVVALARQRGIELSLQQIAHSPTIAELARKIRFRDTGEDEAAPTEPFSLLSDDDRARLPEDVVDAYPLTRLQAGMIYHIEEKPDAPVFHSINSYHLRLPYDFEAFQGAVIAATARHPNLRTSFDLAGYSEPLQLVHRDPFFPVGSGDLRHLDAEGQEKALREFWERELVTPFDLSRAPQLRFHLHRRSGESFQFTLTENHAVIDGWSLHTLYSEIMSRYFALMENKETSVPEPEPLQTTFRDFVHLERKALESQDSREFWRRKMEDARFLKVPRLPGHRRDPRLRRVNRFDIPLPDELTQRLRLLARQEAVPLKSVLLAAHFKAMSFIGGETDVLTSLSSNGRPETLDGHRALGLFLNTLPIRLRLTGGTWRELARRVHEEEMEILPHRRYPLAAIQEVWGPGGLLETSFVYLNFHVMGDIVRARQVETLDAGMFIEETNFPVMTAFQSSYTSDTLIFNLDCDRDALADDQIESLRDSYLRILGEMAYNPEGRHDTFSPLSGRERARLLQDWNDSRRDYDLERPVHERFAAQAAARPDAPCLVFEGEVLTYGEVNARANRLAHRLQALGLGPEKTVAVCLERSAGAAVAILATLKAGAAYVPMDVSHPQERLELLVRDARAAAVVTGSRWAGKLSGCGAPLLLEDEAEEAAAPAGNPRSGVTPDHLAYVLYTSGSTGNPKGVAIGHRQLSNYLASILEVMSPEPGASYALTSTLAADLGTTMIFGALTTGGCLHVISEERARDAEALAEAFARHPVDALKIVPSHLAALLEHEDPARLLPGKWLILGGEALDRGLAARIQDLAPGCRVFNEYGPTEATVAVLVEELESGDAAEAASVPVGRPMGNARVHLLSSDLGLVPPGVAAELYIGGVNLARGYLGEAGLTAERFIPDPFGSAPGARLYRTGDLARRLPDGRVEFLGRIDRQVKIRGFRVEIGEVEAALRRHPGVRDAVLTVREEGGDPSLAAYFVASPEVGEAELRGFLASKLPPYMVPAAFVRLDALPLTANGKVDRRALPAPAAQAGARSFVPPRNEVELQLVHLWEEILGVSPVSVTDDFFELGGNSLMAVRLVAQIRKQFGQRLLLSALVDTRTIRKLARLLQGEPDPHNHLVAVQPRGTKPPVYFVHPGHGTVVCYLELARHLGTDQPFYGLQSLDLDYDGNPYVSVEEMAARYVAVIREAQPEGPYLLGGWSFGGLIAFEMAQQLQRAGESVTQLFLLDCSVPVITEAMSRIGPDLMRAFLMIDHARDAAITAGKEPLPLTPHDIVHLSMDEQLELLLHELARRDAFPLDVDREMLRRYFHVRMARIDAMNNYVPQPYPGRVVLYRTSELNTEIPLAEIQEIYRNASLEHPSYGWSELIREVAVEPVPGHHESMIREPHVRDLAAALKKHLGALGV